MAILEPSDEATVPATARGSELRANLAVRGSAAPDTQILVSSGCGTGCTDTVEADATGAWEAKLLVRVPASQPTAALKAINALDPGATARADVRLRVPPAKPTKKPGGKRKPRKPSSRRPPPASTTPPPATSTPAPAQPPSGPRSMLMEGDSLAVGTQSLLPGRLPGWQVVTDAQKGRTLSAGMARLRSLRSGSGPIVLGLSLFTNDSPRNVSSLESAVRESVSLAGPNGCAIWATIVRPPVGGVSYAEANRTLTRLGAELGRVRIVPWADAVRQNPGWLGRDGVHATATGYAARAQMYADAARSC